MKARGGKKKLSSAKRELLRRLAVATRDDWMTPVALEVLKALRDKGPLGAPRIGERAEAFAKLRTARLIELHNTTSGVRLYRLTAEGRARLEAPQDGQVGPAASA